MWRRTASRGSNADCSGTSSKSSRIAPAGFRSEGFPCKICQGQRQIKLMGRVKILAGFSLVAAALGAATADAGFRTPESLIRNVYAYYGKGSPAFSNGLPHDEDAARQFFDSSLRAAWSAPHDAPYDFLVQSPTWRLGPISIAVLRRQFDKTDVTV